MHIKSEDNIALSWPCSLRGSKGHEDATWFDKIIVQGVNHYTLMSRQDKQKLYVKTRSLWQNGQKN